MTPEQQQLLDQYKTAKAAFDAAKTFEQDMRKRVVAVFGNAAREEGTERLYLPDLDEELVMGKRQNYNVENEKVEHLQGIVPPDMFAALFKKTYTLSITTYRLLSQAQKQVIDYALTITDGMPSLKIEASKRVI